MRGRDIKHCCKTPPNKISPLSAVVLVMEPQPRKAKMSEWIELADGVTRVPAAAVAALDKLEEKWPGATFKGARPAIVAAVIEALAF
jgi:hypothetical protein